MLTTLKTKIEERCEDLERMGRVTETDGLAWALKAIAETELEHGTTARWNVEKIVTGHDLQVIFSCSHCHVLGWTRTRYCPECGARMEDVK